MTDLSVIIVNFNTRERTLACLESLAANAPRASLDVVLVDNGSTDGSVEAIRAAHPSVLVVEAGENLGFARGVNLAVRHSVGRYVLLLNPDTIVLPGSLESLVDFADENPHYGLYGGRTLRADGSLDPSSCWGAPSLWSLLSFALGLSTAFKHSRVFDPESLGNWQRDTVREVPVITGCLLLMRRDDWDGLGGMDELYFLYGEDADFSSRAIRAGHRPVVVPEAVIVHDVGGSTSSPGVKMCMVMAGKATLLERTWSAPAAAIGIALLQLGALIRGVGELARKREPSWWLVWQRRRDWRRGYPDAERTIFGRTPHERVSA